MRDPELALLVDRLMRRIHFGLQAQTADFDKMGVGPGGGIILITLAEMGQTGLNELTKRVARDKSQMTRTMRSLERKGLVERQPSANDGRVTMVSLTEEGETVVGELMEAVTDVIDDLFEPISQDERQTLKDLLRRVAS